MGNSKTDRTPQEDFPRYRSQVSIECLRQGNAVSLSLESFRASSEGAMGCASGV